MDAYCHLHPELPADALLTVMDRAGVEKAVLLSAGPLPFRGPITRARLGVLRTLLGVRSLAMSAYRVAHRTVAQPLVHHPEEVLAAARAHPDRFVPFAFIDPRHGDAAHQALDQALEAGVRGVKLHPWFHGYRLPTATGVLERCQAAGLPVFVHLGFGPPEDVEQVLTALPRLTLVVAHAGVPHFERLWHLDRLVFHIAWPPTLASGRRIRNLLRAVGPERLIWGSDAPVGLRARGGHRYLLPPLPQRVMGDNVLELLG